MIPYEIIVILLSTFSILLYFILFITVIQIKKELDQLKESTKLTEEELEKISERLEKLKTLSRGEDDVL